MTRMLQAAIVCGMAFIGQLHAHGQTVLRGTAENDQIAVRPASPIAVGPNADGFDFSLMLPVRVGVSGVNGVTDQYGMPISRQFLKGPLAETRDENTGITADEAPARGAFTRIRPNTKRPSAKPKVVRRTNRSMASTGPLPQYHLPHGSLEWTPGDEAIDTSPSNRYGYGYGTSGYGTEVFGDFWKGWPIVQY